MSLSDVFVAESMLLLYFTRGCVREKKGNKMITKKRLAPNTNNIAYRRLLALEGTGFRD